MDPSLATVAVATITTVGGLVGVAIREFRRMRQENRNDHGTVMSKLEQVQEDHKTVLRKLNKVQDSVDHVSERVDDHIDWHLRG